MNLAHQQSQFILALMSDEGTLPGNWQNRHRAGFQVYRSAYRARLIDTLRETYPCTALLAGEEAFEAAAAHHLITHPPTSWTIDDAGRGFARTVEGLFPRDPEVAELAWIEWAMHTAFTAPDVDPLDAACFAAAATGYSDMHWQEMRLCFVPDLAVRRVGHDCQTLWRLLADQQDTAAARTLPALPEPKGCAVWREGSRTTFALIDLAEAEALQLMLGGGGYGAACDLLVERMGEEPALPVAGGMLARWLANGWIASVHCLPAA